MHSPQKSLPYLASFLLALCLLQPLPALATKLKQVYVLFSYREGWWVVEHEDQGVINGLAKMGYTEEENIQITRRYMSTKTVNKTTELMEKAASTIVAEIQVMQPDLLIIMDDDALRHVGAKFFKSETPIVFGGINLFVTDAEYGWLDENRRTSLADTLERPGHNITGVLERIAISAGFNFLQQLVPEAKTALFISDNSLLSHQLLRSPREEDIFSGTQITIVKKVFTDSYEDMQKTVLDYQDKVDTIVMFLPWTYEDNNGNHVPQELVVRWLLQNNKRPGVAYLDILAEEGFLCGVVVDIQQQGIHAGVMGGRILNGEHPAEIAILDPIANRLMINQARAKQLGIDIPFAVLKNTDKLLKTMSVYPEFSFE